MKTIILAGGSGTRLWPLSRKRYPKQFIKLMGAETSLFQDTFMRALMVSDLEDIYVVTNKRMKFLVMGEIEELGYDYDENQILVEPEAKNTLPAICYGVTAACRERNDSIVVFPSDHVVEKPEKLVKVISESEELSKKAIITFGVRPNKPHTGYGYIQPGEKNGNGFDVLVFREKPDAGLAAKYMEEGCLWNSGIFMFDSGVFMEEVKMHVPAIHDAFSFNGDVKEAFSSIGDGISIDYGIMEKTGIAAVVPIDVGWNDLGSFESFYDVYEGDSNGNIDRGNSV
ncbi:MAG TPA: mannose-1-phosphate guanylyltransferase, partial [Clostridia bacterium]|nr:mannose-1-phosphate guanylyltransferase [Clostridia bacterium]